MVDGGCLVWTHLRPMCTTGIRVEGLGPAAAAAAGAKPAAGRDTQKSSWV